MNDQLHSGEHFDAEQLGALVEGATSEREREEMLAHAADCAECRDLLFLMQHSEVPGAEPVVEKPIDRIWRRRLLPIGLAGFALASGLTLIVYVRTSRVRPPAPSPIAKVEAPHPASASEHEAESTNEKRKLPQPANIVPGAKATGSPAKPSTAPGAVHGTMAGSIGGPLLRNKVQTAPGAQASSISSLWAQKTSAQPANPESADARVIAPPEPGVAAPSEPSPSIGSPPAATPGAAQAPAATAAINPFKEKYGLAVRIEPNRGPDNGLSEVSGIITDMSGAVVPGATVTLRTSQSAAAETRSAADGRFTISNLPPGKYEISVVSPGFLRATRAVDLKPRDLAFLDSVLQVGAVSETVAVTAESSTLETSMAEVSSVPATLPGGGTPTATLSSGKRTLSLDTAGALFISNNTGKSWKKVKHQWQGKVTSIALKPRDEGERKEPRNKASVFQLTTESGAVWESADGRHWRPSEDSETPR